MVGRPSIAIAGLAITAVIAGVALTRGPDRKAGEDGSSAKVAVVSAGSPGPSSRRSVASASNETAPTPSPDRLAVLSGHVDHALSGAEADAVRLHQEVETGSRGPATEQAENRMVSAMPAGIGVALKAEAIQARCGGLVCELSGELAGDVPTAREDLTNGHWLDTLPRPGYAPGPVVVERTEGRTTFVMYVRRLQ